MVQKKEKTKQNLLKNIQNLKNKTVSIITDKTTKKEKVSIDEERNEIEKLRIEHHELNKLNEEIEKSNAQLELEKEKELEKIEEGKEHLKELEELYRLAKERYEEKLNERKEIEKSLEQKNEKIEINQERIKRNKNRKEKIKEYKGEVSKSINARMEEAILSNPRQISKALRKEILDLMFEDDSHEYFEEFEDNIVRFTIRDEKDTRFFIDVNLEEEGLVIYTKQGNRGKIRLVAVTKNKDRGIILVEPNTQEPNEEIDRLAKDIIFEIMDKKEKKSV